MSESSAIDEAPKLWPMSTKDGSEPVVSPFKRCNVVVGGSAYELNKSDWFGRDADASLGTVRTL
jgi:hypothetical protein